MDQLSKNPTKSKSQSALKKSTQVIEYREKHLDPLRTEYTNAIKQYVRQRPSFTELTTSLNAIKALIRESIDVTAPIDHTILTWSYNILLERAQEDTNVKF